ncbi:YbaL family putative K(+) efflux transporter [Granulibacter bethesdensis]|uniref:Potassium/proton antiporter rosB n=2 Tax=Granulibacter bethesdensis TaxID=364410 RepID=Q0BTW5_GRABC|nr:YbaL family putative K(+) efflux transporter [Granulibacter bethesdensis]ABI61737.1 Potassium/proton antiporter rosB [Granulibacter bethesdensis CGDNIH1]AHJ62663.1 Potassium/proton antiporter rosB [Granulibacter bethesdensis]AHJ69442.1 Potassium/proton antiporter rosB [Granulibacter bethesdensis]APH51545.1 Potassium/proton antiporter rosB [Granulibacter bethesdensis]APH64238.1 Potassium/proton antiporter rosB [Granulibacter bethesdensis]
MAHDNNLIAMIVIGFGLAFLFGTAAHRLRLPPLVGYLLAGVALGPFTPGFVADQTLSSQLAEIGVILLMFGTGLHFSVKDLQAVKNIAVPGALLQVSCTSLLGFGAALLFGWSVGAAIVFGFCLSVASTVVLMRALQDRHLMETAKGRHAIGWLIIQDLVTVLILVLLPALTGVLKGGKIDVLPLLETIGLTLGKVIAFIVLMMVIGKRVIPMVLHYAAHTGSREIFRLAVLAIALSVAFTASELFGVSFALGAFFAGVVLSESQLSQRAAEESLPLRDAFAVLFFVSVGMLVNPSILIRQPVEVMVTVAVVVIGTPLVTFLILRALRQSMSASMMIAAGLGQIGEFSFILASLGVSLGLMPKEGQDMILGASIISIFLNPLLFSFYERRRQAVAAAQQETVSALTTPTEDKIPAQPESEEPDDTPVPTTLRQHAVLVGAGRVGGLIAAALLEGGKPLVVIEENNELARNLRDHGADVFLGNAAGGNVLDLANVTEARLLLIAIPNAFEAGQIVEQARQRNPNLEIVCRAHFDDEVRHLQEYGADFVVMGEREIALAMLNRAETVEVRHDENPDEASPSLGFSAVAPTDV